MARVLDQTWDLESIFPGGSSSSELEQSLQQLEQALDELTAAVGRLQPQADDWAAAVALVEKGTQQLVQTAAFVSCLMAQDVRDEKAVALYGRIRALGARLDAAVMMADDKLKELTDEQFAALMSDERLAPVAFVLGERRQEAAEKMDTARELLANDLAVDGYHALQTLYDKVVGRLTVEFDGEELSVGQAANRFADPDRKRRAGLFQAWEKTWADAADLAAHALNHLAGFRLSLYKQRGWDDVLKEPLMHNRLQKESLDAMWSAVSQVKPRLKRYLERKAKLLGADTLAWYDTDAAVGTAERIIPYDEAAQFIEDQFARFSPRMAQFARHAFDNRWIEAEDRPNKRPGGFCTSLPLSKQSRIFMTYSATPGSQSTLAHELGHAYHTHVMADLRPMVTSYPMNVAETASTFAELIVSSAAIEQTTDKTERIALLGKRLDEAVAYLMNIHARFLFETAFYERRRSGLLSVDELNALMEDAQRTAYADGLDTYHPLFWASKLHFYITGRPFYNFPYTFGYLFSAAIYARAKEEGPTFENKYVDLLRDTGRMTAEQLARQHLGADLTQAEFWRSGLRVMHDDLEQFLALTE